MSKGLQPVWGSVFSISIQPNSLWPKQKENLSPFFQLLFSFFQRLNQFSEFFIENHWSKAHRKNLYSIHREGYWQNFCLIPDDFRVIKLDSKPSFIREINDSKCKLQLIIILMNETV